MIPSSYRNNRNKVAVNRRAPLVQPVPVRFGSVGPNQHVAEVGPATSAGGDHGGREGHDLLGGPGEALDRCGVGQVGQSLDGLIGQ